MKIYTLIIFAILQFSCTKKTNTDFEKSENKTFDSLNTEKLSLNESVNYDWQENFHLTHNSKLDSIEGKPLEFYIENKKCDSLAVAFYYGKYRPSDDNFISDLLVLSSTNNNDLRPFYRWILDKTIEVSDGALGEYPGIPARKYAEKFPEEFFNFIDSDINNTTYLNWTNSISYSGFYENEDYDKPELSRKKLEKEMIKNSSVVLKNRIIKFSLDCFPNVNKTNL